MKILKAIWEWLMRMFGFRQLQFLKNYVKQTLRPTDIAVIKIRDEDVRPNEPKWVEFFLKDGRAFKLGVNRCEKDRIPDRLETDWNLYLDTEL